MNEAEARAILGDSVQPDGSLYTPALDRWNGGDTITLDDYFTADQLEAIAWWIRNAPQGIENPSAL